MNRLMTWTAALVMAVAFAGCASNYPGNPAPCASCKYGVQRQGRAEVQKWTCVVNGKEVNCSANEAGCETCKK